MSDSRAQLLRYFRRFETLSETGPLKEAKFKFPSIDELPPRAILGRRLSDTTRSLETPPQTKRNAAERLSAAVAEVTKKRQFGKTSLSEWQATLTFAGDRAVRESLKKRYRIARSTVTRWEEGSPINLSAEVADDWFLNHLLPRVAAGAEFKHSSAVVGSPGCGKSTLLKFLIIKHSEAIRQQHIVFSRFEFLKFWYHWRSPGPLLDDISNYLSFANLRDLVIHHILKFEDGIPKALRFELSIQKRLDERIAEIYAQARNLAPLLGYDMDKGQQDQIAQVLRSALNGNTALMAAVRGLPHRLRVLLIGVLSNNVTLVTIFDGMDSVRIEDAFAKTDQFVAVNQIIWARRHVTQFRALTQAGIAVQVDSVTVMRSNTAALINLNAERDDVDAQFADYFELHSVDAKAALAGAALRSANLLQELKEGQSAELNNYVFGLMTILKRTMIAISRGYGKATPYQLIFGLFDGNLRELFSFLELVVNWQTKEMLSGNYLESSEYMGINVARLVAALSSPRGNELLKKKSYRIVELLLLNEGDVFENAVSVKWTSDTLLSGSDKSTTRLSENPKFAGHVDNVFNYLPSIPQSGLDQHGLLEKIRILQLCESNALTTPEIAEQLKENFGYEAFDLRTTVQFLLKTNCLSASIETRDGEERVILKATNRALLCIKTLIFNLSYLEHVFHKTLLPECLIRDIGDRRRRADVTSWVASSVRNAFILVSYVNFVENHRASGKEVPARFRIAEEMRKGINSAVERMTSSGSPEAATAASSGGTPITAEIVCNRSIAEIGRLVQRWKVEKVVADRQ